MRAVGGNGEFDLSGTSGEFAEFREGLRMFCADDGEESFVVDLECGFDPAPYDVAFRSVVLMKSAGKLVLSTTESELIVSGNQECLRSMCEWLPVDVEEVPYHVHFDGISLRDHFAREEQGIVFSVCA